MNVGDPNIGRKTKCRMRESDMPIVVTKPGKVKTGIAKGHYCKSNFLITNTVGIDLKKS